MGLLLLVAAATPAAATRGHGHRVKPIRAAFYYPWFPGAWGNRAHPLTRYKPSLGLYSSFSRRIIRRHLRAMRYAGLGAAISSWWGRGTVTDRAFKRILKVSARTAKSFRWSIYYEPEGYGDPSVAQIRSDLHYLRWRYWNQPNYLRIHNRPVVVVWSDPSDDCSMSTRWHEANDVGAYVVLKVFPGYEHCSPKPSWWHQYAPVDAVQHEHRYSYTISPGFWKADEAAPRLARDLTRWRQDVRAMARSHARLQLVTTFNEWGEGTAVESASEWKSPSHYGLYLDALHAVLTRGQLRAPTRSVAARRPRRRQKTATLLAAGDIASCDSSGDDATARMLRHLRGVIATLGDTVYESGTPQQFAACYAPTWGRQRWRTRPAVGNHDYLTPGASGYFHYFGARAGSPTKGYYSYGLGAWHIVVLNGNCPIVSCSAGSPQLRWLRSDLASHRRRCTLAYWHQPRFSSGQHGDETSYTPFWQALYSAHADVVLNGHDHDYERFAPQDPNGKYAPGRGIREFVVGTGGKNHYAIGSPVANSQVRNDDTFGVLQLKLRRRGYRWRFIPAQGKTFTDAGSALCH